MRTLSDVGEKNLVQVLLLPWRRSFTKKLTKFKINEQQQNLQQ